MTILHMHSFDDYRAALGLNVSRLKLLQHSPAHYHANASRTSAAMNLGTAAHMAVLEPKRFADEVVVWDRRTDGGAMSPRRGKEWDKFLADNPGKTILTPSEYEDASAIAKAVHAHPVARQLLAHGEPEVSFFWVNADGRTCKGRADWVCEMTDVGGGRILVGLKTTRDARPRPFAAAAARLGYHLQWAWYQDGWIQADDSRDTLAPTMIEIVVESEAPHAVAVYEIPQKVMDVGRAEISECLELLKACEASGKWPGISDDVIEFDLPAWCYGDGVDLEITDAEVTP